MIVLALPFKVGVPGSEFISGSGFRVPGSEFRIFGDSQVVISSRVGDSSSRLLFPAVSPGGGRLPVTVGLAWPGHPTRADSISVFSSQFLFN